MGVGIYTQFAEVMRQAEEIFHRNILTALTKLGEECVARVRDRSQEESWFDQTGNLRSSIGYAVYDNGLEFMKSAFRVVKNGSVGASTGASELSSLASKYGDTVALVIVAGMSYADRVEALKNKDVLASTKVWAESIVQERLQRAVDASVKEVNGL